MYKYCVLSEDKGSDSGACRVKPSSYGLCVIAWTYCQFTTPFFSSFQCSWEKKLHITGWWWRFFFFFTFLWCWAQGNLLPLPLLSLSCNWYKIDFCLYWATMQRQTDRLISSPQRQTGSQISSNMKERAISLEICGRDLRVLCLQQ